VRLIARQRVARIESRFAGERLLAKAGIVTHSSGNLRLYGADLASTGTGLYFAFGGDQGRVVPYADAAGS
jgi:hypothetical protein